MGDQVADAVGLFPTAFDTQQACLQKCAVLPLSHLAPDNHVDRAELVFQRDESDTAGGLRALALGHQAGDAHAAGGWSQAQRARIRAMVSQQTRTNLLQGMRAQAQAQARVISQGVLRL